jgi:hypothetical protein
MGIDSGVDEVGLIAGSLRRWVVAGAAPALIDEDRPPHEQIRARPSTVVLTGAGGQGQTGGKHSHEHCGTNQCSHPPAPPCAALASAQSFGGDGPPGGHSISSWLNQIESDERNAIRDSLLQSLDQGV